MLQVPHFERTAVQLSLILVCCGFFFCICDRSGRSYWVKTTTRYESFQNSLKCSISSWTLCKLCKSIFLRNATALARISSLPTLLWTAFSKDAGLSSLVSIEPNTDCSQWLSSVSDMKEWAQACLTPPPAVHLQSCWKEKGCAGERNKQPTCTVKQRRML